MRRHLIRVMAVVVVLVVLVVIAVFTVANTDWGREKVRNRVVAMIQGNTHGIVKVGSVSGNLLKGFTLNDLVITDSSGAPFVKVDSASARYGLRSIFGKRIELDAVRLVRPVFVLDKPPGGKWNWDRIFPRDTMTKAGRKKTGWGTWIRFTEVTMIDGDVTARSPWTPRLAKDLNEADVIRTAMGPEGRFLIVKVPNGYQKISTFHHINAKIPLLRLEDPAYEVRHADVAALSMIAEPFKPPQADVRSLVGSFDFTGDSLWWEKASAVLPGSKITGAGKYNINNSNLTLRLHADPVASADIRWVYPRIPAKGSGKMDFALDWVGDTSVYVVRNADMMVENAHLKGDLGLVYRGQDVSVQKSNFTFASLDTRLIERVFPLVKIPRSGILNGRAKLDGDPKSLALDADVTFDDRKAGRNHVIAVGGIGFPVGGQAFAKNLKLTLRPIQIDVLRSYVTSLPPGGTLAGTATLNGNQKNLGLDADVVVSQKAGTSHVLAVGNVGLLKNDFRADNLRLTMRPLQVSLLRNFATNLPIGGTITGTATLNGLARSRMTAKADITHVDRGNQSRLTGTAAFRPSPSGNAASTWFDVDAQLHPLSFATVGRFFPKAGLRGSASGPLRLTGTMANLAVNTRLGFQDGGSLGLVGKFNLASKVPVYDAKIDANVFNANALMAKAPRTSVTGLIAANGVGTDPATMRANIIADLKGSTYDTLSITSATVRLSAANGMARIDTLSLVVPEGIAEAKGTFGLAAGTSGQMTYHVEVDSLNRLAPFFPADTGAVLPRPGILAGRSAKVKADSARLAKATEVERAVTGRAAPTIAPVDTPRVISRSVLAGSLRADGVATGNIKNFGLKGTASGQHIVARGSSAEKFFATYDWTNALTPQSRVDADVSATKLLASGFDLDSVHAKINYKKPNGAAEVTVVQNAVDIYSANADFVLNKDANEVRLNRMQLRFDSTVWASTRPSLIRWGVAGIDINTLELRNSTTGRIYVNGLLPKSGRANLELAVDNFEVADLISLAQSDIPAHGLVSFDVKAAGTAADPTFSGSFGTQNFFYNGTLVPELHGTLSYANQTLTTNTDAMRGGQQPFFSIKGTIPINLAFTGVTGPRISKDRQMDVAITADSLPLDMIPNINTYVTNLKGKTVADFKLAGSLSHPEVTGKFLLDSAQAYIVPIGLMLTRMNGSIRMLRDTVVIDSLVAYSGGRIQISGGLGIGSFREPSFDLKVFANNATVLNDKDGKLNANINLAINGPFNDAHVGGDVRILDGVLFVPKSEGKKIIGTSDPALFSVMDTAVLANREIFPTQSPLLANLRMDVNLRVDRDVFVRSSDFNIEVYSDGDLAIHVNRAKESLVLDGVLLSERGEYSFLSKRFDIKHGSATFINSDEINPTLQVTGGYEVRLPSREAINIQILIGGTMRNPQISLESDAQPPITQSDLLSYLAFGRSSSSLLQLEGSGLGGSNNLVGAGAALASKQLAAVALGVFADQVSGEAARALGADVFNIAPADVETDVGSFLRGTQVEYGKYIKSHTFISVTARPDPSALRRPGILVQHRFGGLKGYSLETSLQPRFLLKEPTLDLQAPTTTSVLSLFIVRSWRY
ncbi:MAG TPA: translocation/assembly module TamB domain-containing protein [Gemmatimonadaceae bacterium]|nr:translocation/assembly module TamB domain-containing protein [Gemmatimonadaceae bacterium]